jgi:cytoskeleton protein RodZ
MDELGHILREARETKGYTLEDVQDEIRINVRYLKSLEEGEYDALPTPVHVRGFLRNYARFLGLDPQPLLNRYETNMSRSQPKAASLSNGNGRETNPSLRPIDPNSSVFYDPVNVEVDVGQRRNPESLLRIVIVIALIAALALVANRFVPLLLGNGDGSAVITEGINETINNLFNRGEDATGEQTPDEGDPLLLALPTEPINNTSRNIFEVTPPAAMPTRPTLPATMSEINLRVDIGERTWMEVTIDGDVVFTGWARSDDPPYEWRANREAKINTGNAAGVFVTINDIPWGRMGERGENKEEIWRTTN